MDRAGDLVSLEVAPEMWERFFTVSPLVLVGTREENGEYDLAPKHMAFPLGSDGYFAFVCTPEHNTYWNARRERVFTVSYPCPTQVLLTSLAAAPRDDTTGCKVSLQAIPTFPAEEVDGVLLEDGYLFFECVLDRVLDDFGASSLLIGRIVAAHASADALRHSDSSEQEMLFETPLLAYLRPGRFCQIRRTLRFPFYEPMD